MYTLTRKSDMNLKSFELADDDGLILLENESNSGSLGAKISIHDKLSYKRQHLPDNSNFIRQ